jgi:RNA-directed DNA polymerase
LIDGHQKWDWLVQAVNQRLQEELTKVDVEINQDKTKIVDLARGETFSFLGFDFRQKITLKGKKAASYTPTIKARTALTHKIKGIFKRSQSQPIKGVIEEINPILRGWTNYFRIGNSSRHFGYIRDWVERKVRRHLMRSRKRKGFGWNRWSSQWIYQVLGLFSDYQIRYHQQTKVSPAQ